MLIAGSFPFLEVLWAIVIFFAFLIWVSLLFLVFADLFGRDDASGWLKVGWVLLLVILPYLGVFAYLIAERPGMGGGSGG